MGGEEVAIVGGEKARNLKGGRGVNSMNLNNNSMNGTSLQNHYKGNNSNLFAQSSISNEMMRKNMMNDIIRCSIDAVESNFNNSTRMGT
jgi:hypothetical protein